jgi:cysteine desulfurase
MPPAPGIYLDHAATTRPSLAVADAVRSTQLEAFGNPSSRHAFGEAARKLLEDAREFLRGTVGAASLIFTSGGTEADVLGVTGAAQGRPPGRVLVGAADHPAVLAQHEMLARTQHRLVTVAVDACGTLEPEALRAALAPDVRVVSILHGHNELGGLARIDELVAAVRAKCPAAHVHVDLVQAYGKVAFDLEAAGVDSVAVSAHKLHGPRGIGFLACGGSARVFPLQEGGGQEHGMRGGTENVAATVGFAVAAERALSHLAATARHMTELTDILCARVRELVPEALRLGVDGRRLPHVLSLRLPGIVAETLQQRAAARGLAFSTGAACHGSAAPSHVLAAIGLAAKAAREVVRLSVSGDTTSEEIEAALAILGDEVRELQKLAGAL